MSLHAKRVERRDPPPGDGGARDCHLKAFLRRTTTESEASLLAGRGKIARGRQRLLKSARRSSECGCQGTPASTARIQRLARGAMRPPTSLAAPVRFRFFFWGKLSILELTGEREGEPYPFGNFYFESFYFMLFIDKVMKFCVKRSCLL
jgi:hypothetical protein